MGLTAAKRDWLRLSGTDCGQVGRTTAKWDAGQAVAREESLQTVCRETEQQLRAEQVPAAGTPCEYSQYPM